jgi:hypothetical protein
MEVWADYLTRSLPRWCRCDGQAGRIVTTSYLLHAPTTRKQKAVILKDERWSRRPIREARQTTDARAR